MAKKQKQEEPPKGAPAWMCTFSDLMNLLLCFFVLLFAMSSVDSEKWDQVVASLTSSFSIFDGGFSSIGEGLLISAGTSQLNDLDEYYNNMGEMVEDVDGEVVVEKTFEEKLLDKNMEETLYMYDNIAENIDDKNLEDYLDVEVDPGGQYVELTISGTFLFDSAQAEIKADALPILSKLGDVLKLYDDSLIEIIGHTDNIPMNSSTYADNDILSSARAISAKNYLVNVKGLDVTTMKWSGKGEYEPVASNSTAEGRARNRRIEIRVYNSLNSK